MRIDEIIETSSDPTFSFEFFPPKTDEAEAALHGALETLREMDPSFVSGTYGATARSTSCATCAWSTGWKRWRT